MTIDSFSRLASTLLLLAACALTAGCLRSSAFQCTTDDQCGAGNTCVAAGVCAVPAAATECPSGLRFDTSAGDRAGTCVPVDGAGAADARPMEPDAPAPIDATPRAPRNLCLASAGVSASQDACAARVCAIEGRCCSLMWTDACVQLAATRCHDLGVTCRAAVSTAGWHQVGVALHDPTRIASARTLRCIAAPTDGQPAVFVREMAWADRDGDGDADVAMGTLGGAHVLDGRPLDGDGHLAQAPPDTVRLPAREDANYYHGSALAWGDADGDGDLELAAVHDVRGPVVALWSFDGAVPTQQDIAFEGATPMPATGVGWVEANGAPGLELVVSSGNEVQLLGRDAGGAWRRLDRFDGGQPMQGIATHFDRVLVSGFVLEASGGRLREITRLPWGGVDADWVYLDGDNRPDLVVTASLNLAVLLDRNDTYAPVVLPEAQRAAGGEGVDVGDLDGDGDIDIAIMRTHEAHDVLRHGGLVDGKPTFSLHRSELDVNGSHGGNVIELVSVPTGVTPVDVVCE